MLRLTPASSSRPWTLVLITATALLGACAPLRPAPEQVPPPASEPAHPAESAARAPAGVDAPEVNERYAGQYRATAKTRFALLNGAPAPTESFADLEALRAFLKAQIDVLMRRRYAHLGGAGADASGRVSEERHNVTVVAYIHAVKHESGAHGDRDFHIMLGSSATAGGGIFMTAEASALPAAGEQRPQLAQARRALLSILGTCRCDGRFMPVSPPIRVQVTGSLFFDGAHGIGSVGPPYAKPYTVWEIHPLLSIEAIAAGPQ